MTAIMLTAMSHMTASAKSVSASKVDGKFSATVPVEIAPFGLFKSTAAQGFFKSVELEVTWWSLLGQPVYYNTLTWHIRDEVLVDRYANYHIYLKRSALMDHPDLLEKFEQLRPLSIDIHLHAKLVSSDTGDGMDTYFDNAGQYSFDRTIKDVELMIAGSGRRGENISPGSPSYREFVGHISRHLPSAAAKGIEKRLSATFTHTERITFGWAKISALKLPNRNIQSIYDELMTRERGCSKYIDNPLAWTCGEEEEEEEEAATAENAGDGESVYGDNTGNDGNAGDVIEPQKKKTETQPAHTAVQDDFWKDGGTSTTPPANVQSPSKSQDGFWDNGGQTATSSTDSDWSDGLIKSDESFDIVTRDGNQGVVEANGQTLIPFKDWEIHSYSEGLAKVTVSESQKLGVCGTRYDYNTFYVVAKRSGYVDRSGDWVVTLEKSVSPESSRYAQLVLTSERHDMTYDEKQRAKEVKKRREAKERREERECEARIKTKRQSAYSTYRAKGYTVKP